MDLREEANDNWMNQLSSIAEKDISGEIDALNLEEISEIDALYPIRPSEPDCAFYLRTGCCKFGSFCRFNHPREKIVVQIIKERDKGFPKVFDRCKFYPMPGGCRFGEACKYRHSHEIPESVPVELNDLGLPIRKGERVCSHYMRTGICKYGSSCKFHHPELSGVAGLHVYASHSASFLQSTMWSSHLSATSQTLQATSNDSGSNLDILQPSNPANILDSILPSLSMANCHPFTVDQNGYLKLEDSSMQQKEVIDNHKEPGESQSQNGINYEDFKLALPWWPYRSKDYLSETEGCVFSSIGLPQRPDHPICIYYSRFGICKYGPACKFDHPMDEKTEQSNITSSSEEKREDESPPKRYKQLNS